MRRDRSNARPVAACRPEVFALKFLVAVIVAENLMMMMLKRLGLVRRVSHTAHVVAARPFGVSDLGNLNAGCLA